MDCVSLSAVAHRRRRAAAVPVHDPAWRFKCRATFTFYGDAAADASALVDRPNVSFKSRKAKHCEVLAQSKLLVFMSGCDTSGGTKRRIVECQRGMHGLNLQVVLIEQVVFGRKGEVTQARRQRTHRG